MCSVVILLQPEQEWSVLIAANRDEMANRPSLPPGRHWPDRPDIIAGLDQIGGGSWLGLNDYGVVAILLNSPHSLGPAPGFRSRGELVLEALDHADADQAAAAMMALNPDAYRPFHLLITDNRDAFVLSHNGGLLCQKLSPGLSMITAHGVNNPASGRFRTWFPMFQQATIPDPETDQWQGWQNLMLDRSYDPDTGPMGAMFIRRPDGFGTRATTLIGLPGMASEKIPVLHHMEHE